MQRTIYVCDRCEAETPKAELYSVTVKPPRGKQRNALELCSTCVLELTRPALELAKA